MIHMCKPSSSINSVGVLPGSILRPAMYRFGICSRRGLPVSLADLEVSDDSRQSVAPRQRLNARPPADPPRLLRVVHAYKVYTPEVIGGIPEVIRLVAGGLAQSCSSRILVSRMRGRGGREMMGEVPVH